MSHIANRWLADIPSEALSHGEFRALYHLCDCHNPSYGCFPRQRYLIQRTGLSSSGLNKVLENLEERRFLRRIAGRDPDTHQFQNTRYILGFELDEYEANNPPEPEEGPSPLSGDGVPGEDAQVSQGNEGEPSPLSGDGPETAAVSTPEGGPSPLSGGVRLHRSGDGSIEEPVKEPVTEPVRATAPAPKGRAAAQEGKAERRDPPPPPEVEKAARFWASCIEKGKFVPPSAITGVIAAAMVSLKLVTLDRLRQLNIPV